MTRLGYRYAIEFLAAIGDSGITLVRISAGDETRAEQILRQYRDKTFSYTDATSFAVMERLGLAYAFTVDRDFS